MSSTSMVMYKCHSLDECKSYISELILQSFNNVEVVIEAYEKATTDQRKTICKSMKHLFNASNVPILKGIKTYFSTVFKAFDAKEQEKRMKFFITTNCTIFIQYILLFASIKKISDELISFAEEQGEFHDDFTIVDLLESYNYYTVDIKEECEDSSSFYLEIEGDNISFDITYAITGDFMPYDLMRTKKGERKIRKENLTINFFPNIYGLYLHNLIDGSLKKNISWFQESNKYILSLPVYDLYTLHGYTYKGDSVVNKYCISYKYHHPERELDDDFINYLKQIVIDCQRMSSYLCYFFQFQKIVDTYKNQMTRFCNNLISAEILAITDTDNSKAYLEVQKVVTNKTFTKEFWMLVVKLFVEDLERIIDNAPRLTDTLEVFRGTKSHYYTNKKDSDYKNQSFTSTSFVPDVMLSFSKPTLGCCFSKFYLTPDTKCIWMDPVSKMNEYEVLLSPDQSFKITGKEIFRTKSVKSVFLDDSPSVEDKEEVCRSKFKNIDYTILEQA